MKKTLVFYKGRAPKGEKTNWVIHEYRLEGKFSVHNLPKSAKNEWVICRVFQKSSGGKKVHISGLVRMTSNGNELVPSALPPLMDSSPYGNGRIKPAVSDSVHVHCFSNPIDIQTTQNEMFNYLNTPNYTFSSNSTANFPRILFQNGFSQCQSAPNQGNFQFPGTLPIQDQSLLRGLLDNYGQNMKNGLKTEKEMVSVSQETGLSTEMNTEISSVVSNFEMGRRSFEEQQAPSTSAGPLDLDCLWNY